MLKGKEGGSIAGGGRYDGLVGIFSNQQIPAVGVSIGIERLLAILENSQKGDSDANEKKHQGRENYTQVLVATNDPSGMIEERMKVCMELRRAGIAAEFEFKKK